MNQYLAHSKREIKPDYIGTVHYQGDKINPFVGIENHDVLYDGEHYYLLYLASGRWYAEDLSSDPEAPAYHLTIFGVDNMTEVIRLIGMPPQHPYLKPMEA